MVQVIDMLADVFKVTKTIDSGTSAKAALAGALAWEHIGESQQAQNSLSHAESLEYTDPQFTEMLSAAKAIIRSHA